MISAVIDKGSKLEGNITFSGPARIGGVVSGTIFSNSELVITEDAVITADINADVVIISGLVKGSINALSRVEFLRPAQFEGIINSPSLSVEEGVIFHGKTAM